MISKSKLEKILWSLDLSVFTGVFLLMNYNKFDLIFPKNNYLYLYFILIVFWSIFSSYYDKISSLIQKPLWLAIRIIFWSSLMSLLFVVITISFSELWSISRIFMVTFMAIMVFYELIVALTLKSFLKTSGIKVVNIEKTNVFLIIKSYHTGSSVKHIDVIDFNSTNRFLAYFSYSPF